MSLKFMPIKKNIFKSKYVATGPNCKNCKFFIKKENNLNECQKFSRISSQKHVLYEFAEICRKDIDLCGIVGYYFEESDEFLEANFCNLDL